MKFAKCNNTLTTTDFFIIVCTVLDHCDFKVAIICPKNKMPTIKTDRKIRVNNEYIGFNVHHKLIFVLCDSDKHHNVYYYLHKTWHGCLKVIFATTWKMLSSKIHEKKFQINYY